MIFDFSFRCPPPLPFSPAFLNLSFGRKCTVYSTILVNAYILFSLFGGSENINVVDYFAEMHLGSATIKPEAFTEYLETIITRNLFWI